MNVQITKPLRAAIVPEFNANAFNESFATLNFEGRLRKAYRDFSGDGLAVLSSFGPQSALLLEKIAALKLDMPVISIDIPGSEYNVQRAYRDQLHAELGFDLHVEQARDKDDKVDAQRRALARLGTGTVLSGIRASQTGHRASLAFSELDADTGVIHIHPLLDWRDAKAEFYLAQLPQELRHPEYRPGLRAQGGRLLEDGETKEECGLHVFRPASAPEARM